MLSATEAMAERNPTGEHNPEDFEDFMMRGRYLSGTSVGTTRCACGPEKGKTRWTRVADGKPQSTKCSDCGNPIKCKREVGYTNKARVVLDAKNIHRARV